MHPDGSKLLQNSVSHKYALFCDGFLYFLGPFSYLPEFFRRNFMKKHAFEPVGRCASRHTRMLGNAENDEVPGFFGACGSVFPSIRVCVDACLPQFVLCHSFVCAVCHQPTLSSESRHSHTLEQRSRTYVRSTFE